MTKHSPKKDATTWAYQVFYPVACLYAALAVPLSVFAITIGQGRPLALVGLGHGFEMLFGFALAVVAGYTLGSVKNHVLLALFLIWLSARIAQFAAPFSLTALALSMLFGLVLAWLVVPRFVAAKKWRNKLLMPLLGGLFVLPATFLIMQHAGSANLSRLVLHEAVLFFSLLMTFMGGRIIAPAVAGELKKQGYDLKARVQPRVEAALIILLVIAVPVLAVPGGEITAGAMIAAAGLLILFRLLRWQPWRWRTRLDLISLCAGYAWLGVGLCFLGTAIATGWHFSGALHMITVGALGTLTSGVMCRIHYQRLRRSPPPNLVTVWLAACILIAVITRVGANFAAGSQMILLLWFSATAWALCFGTMAWLFTTDLIKFSDSTRPETR